MAGYSSETAWVSGVTCNRTIENKRNKTEKNLLVKCAYIRHTTTNMTSDCQLNIDNDWEIRCQTYE